MNAPIENVDEKVQILRGFEVVRWNGLTLTWDVVGKFRPTELAARQAASDVKWLQDRHPYERYDLRALVSVPRRGDEHEIDLSAPMVLDADNQDGIAPLDPTEVE